MIQPKNAVSHHDAEVAELHADSNLVAAYARVATESLGHPDSHTAALLVLHAITEAINLPSSPHLPN
ncbi:MULTISPECIES: hypothetical protein [Burkholderia]|uniref:hypothetical protein n=1 Tax=Burkholderia TaxID=32008 RepID=UPI000F584114|nr:MULTISPECIES: hypothetical protein [Burkholderia]ELK6466178.1 hypothetical protein [Burkholderia contaminans]VWD38165.1 transcriptional regulator [Burkholderia contaminans]VWD56401.1 transcriptional regulator [Burkholderia contaminans]